MSDNGPRSGLSVPCSACQFTMTLTQDEIVLFYHNFFCLRCGKKTPLPISREVYQQLRKDNNRDRRVPNVVPISGRDTMKHVK